MLKNKINLKKCNRNIKNNNSKVKNIQNRLDTIKKQTLKANINIINKPNILHHNNTNINIMNPKDFLSNIIINNIKVKDNHNNYLNSKNKLKQITISELQNENGKNTKNEYLQKGNILRLNLSKKNNKWKLNNNLQKIIFKDIKIKNANSKRKNSMVIPNLISKNDDKILSFLTIIDKNPDNYNNKNNHKTSYDRRNHYKSNISYNNNNYLNNNINYDNKKKSINNNDNTLNSFIYSLMSLNYIDFSNSLNICLEPKSTFKKNTLNSKEKISKKKNRTKYK